MSLPTECINKNISRNKNSSIHYECELLLSISIIPFLAFLYIFLKKKNATTPNANSKKTKDENKEETR